MLRKKELKAAALVAAAIALMIMVPGGPFVPAARAQQSQQPAASAGPQVPQPEQGGVNWAGAGWGAATLASNVVYIPAKLVYGVMGGLVGGASWALTGGNTQTADTIWRSSLGGDYVVTPDMLQGKRPVHFSGPTTTPPEQSSTIQPLGQAASNAGAPSVTGAAPVSSAPMQGGGTLGSGGSTTAGLAGSGASTAYGASQPIDSGSGPIHGAPAGSPSPAPLPSTSIE